MIKIFEDQLQNEQVKAYLDFASKILPLIDMIINADISLTSTECLNINDKPFTYANSYIERKHPNYTSELFQMWNTGRIHIANYKSDNASCDSYTGDIWLGLNETILDDLYLVHEFFHHQNLIPINDNSVKKEGFTRELFGESISIMSQLDFINDMPDDELRVDSKTLEIDYINDCSNSAKKIKVELALIDIYKINGTLTEELIQNYILNCENSSLAILIREEYDQVIRDISSWGANLKIPFNLKYVLGVVFGYYLADLINKKPNKWYDIYEINKTFYDIDVDEFLDKVEIDFSNPVLLSKYMERYNELKQEFLNKGTLKS